MKHLNFWQSANDDNLEKYTLALGGSLIKSSPYRQLSPGAKDLYICMITKCFGKPEFIFPLATAKEYGFAATTFRKYVRELIEAGFIVVTSHAKERKPNEYRFVETWKRRGR